MNLKWRMDSVCNSALQMVAGAMGLVRPLSLRAARLQGGEVIQAFGFKYRRGVGERGASHLWRMLRQKLMGYAALAHATLATDNAAKKSVL